VNAPAATPAPATAAPSAPPAGGATAHTELSVTGMTCAACQAGIQRALRKEPGVADASVSLVLGRADVTFDPAVVTPDRLIAVVQDEGYGATVAPTEAPSAEADETAAAGEFRALVVRAVVAGALGTLAMPLSMSPGPIRWALLVATLAIMGWAGGRIYFYGRGQKIVNLRRDPMCTVLVDRNEKFPELQAVMVQGRASVLEDAAAEAADPHLQEARIQMGRKYNGGHGAAAVENPPPNGASAGGRNRRWVVVVADHIVTWDNFKLGRRG